MPILKREPDLYPEDLLDRPEVGRESNSCWWAVHTRPRQEKSLARRLLSLEIPFYVPQVEKRTHASGGRARLSFVPLFPSYAFVYGTGEDRLTTFRTNAAVQVLEVPQESNLTFDLRQIRLLTLSGCVLRREDRLDPGTHVRILSGPFVNFEGSILTHRSGNRLLVVVRYLQRGISVEIDDCNVEVL